MNLNKLYLMLTNKVIKDHYKIWRIEDKGFYYVASHDGDTTTKMVPWIELVQHLSNPVIKLDYDNYDYDILTEQEVFIKLL